MVPRPEKILLSYDAKELGVLEDTETLALLDGISREIQTLEHEDRELAVKALQLAIYAHTGQLRKNDRAPHINHVLRLAYRVMKTFELKSARAICAAVLHDVVEDQAEKIASLGARPTGNPSKDALTYIEQNFGTDVSDMVAALTKPKTTKKLTLQEKTDEYLFWITESVMKYPNDEVFYIKLSDIMDNTSDLETLRDPEWQYALAKKYLPVLSLFIERLEQSDTVIPHAARNAARAYLQGRRAVAEKIIMKHGNAMRPAPASDMRARALTF